MSFYKFINHANPKINSILKKIIKLHPEEINLSLNRIKILLKKLNNPENKLPFTVHIAGTNGKGSVATSLYQLQKLNGKKVHVYRSPHLITLNERIVVSNKIISDQLLYDSLNYVYKVNDLNIITFFEFLTATAFYIFSNYKADLFVCEVGLGGNYDATNVLNKKKKLCILTTIGLDHKEYLGKNLEQIAKEKSGILKEKNILICSNQNKKALEVIKEASIVNNCNSFFYGEDWYIKNKFFYFKNIKKVSLSNLSLEGNHQYNNVGCAILACNKLKKFNIENEKISELIAKIKWEGRLEKLKGNIKKKFSNFEFWVDCAHNPLGFNILKNWIIKKKPEHLVIVLGVGIAKDYKGILKQIKKIDPNLLISLKDTNFSNRPAKEINYQARLLKIKCKVLKNIKEALHHFENEKRYKKKRVTCLITGSISLVGEVISIDNN